MLAISLSFADIEEEARQLQLEMWHKQFSIWPGQKVTPMDFCDPYAGASYLGWEVQEGYVTSSDPRDGYMVGGFIDRPTRIIAVSDRLPRVTQRFTLAHELAHAVLHPGVQHMREIPMQGITEPREPTERREREANHFAGVYLVPTKQLRLAFKQQFGSETLNLTDTVAQELLGGNFMQLMNAPYDSLMFERLLGQAVRYQGRHFESLCTLFKVSPTTMAIRLRQCRLARRLGA